jgi:DNA end-binding protein Ku
VVRAREALGLGRKEICMARAMWRGAIQFGLVTIPIKLYLATESRGGLSFNLLHETCLNRISMQTVCPVHGPISRSETVRGYEWSKGQYIVIEDEDFEKVPLKTVRAIEIQQFVEAQPGEYTTTFVKQCYYLEPEAVGRKAFYLLKEVLADTGLEAICKIVLKDREALASINPFSKTMLLSTLYWPDEVRAIEELDLPADEYEFKPAEKQMARQLVEAMTGEFDASQYHDEYREALNQIIQSKVEGKEVEEPEPLEEPSKLTDLMAVLQASVDQARQARAGGAAAASSKESAAKPAARSRSSAKHDEEAPTSVAEARRKRAAKAPAEKAAASSKSAAPAKSSSSSTRAKAAREEEAAAPARRRKTA